MEKEKILIVNGDVKVRQSLEELLQKDYKVFTSPTFKKAFEVYKEEHINTVITELNTDETKGIEVITKFQEVRSDIPIIVVTTHNSVPMAVQAMKAGAYDYITTPFNTDELGMVIMHAMERKKLQEEVKEGKIYQEMAVTDSLTGLYNRRYFDELLIREEARAKRYPQQFSLLMIDIDDFKKFNDTYGHPCGDNILKTVAQILLRRIRNTDYVARYGGEEFCIIAPHTSKQNASVFASRIADIVAQEKFTLSDALKASVTVSIGVANFNDDAQTKEELIKKSDDAMYQAKKLGKNRVCMFGTES
jgi:diguanylate cyclase (GGDEF)-like protein